MTDFFALLDQPRRPWLDLAALKKRYLELTRTTHPDVSLGESTEARTGFESINEAYRTLREPKLRIQHLLTLENAMPSQTNRAVPDDLHDLFLKIGLNAQNSKRLLEQLGNSKSKISRSLLKTDLLNLQQRSDELLSQASVTYDKDVAELQQLDRLWNTDKPQAIARLTLLHDRVAYLSRWIAQLEEIAFQLRLY